MRVFGCGISVESQPAPMRQKKSKSADANGLNLKYFCCIGKLKLDTQSPPLAGSLAATRTPFEIRRISAIAERRVQCRDAIFAMPYEGRRFRL